MNAYGKDQKTHQHYDKAKRENRSNAENFKDYVLITCLKFADKKAQRPVNKDLSWSIKSYIQDWIDADLENIEKTEYTMNEISQLSKKYINNAGGIQDVPEGTAYASGCLDLYHSDDLDKLMKYFVVNPNKTHR